MYICKWPSLRRWYFQMRCIFVNEIFCILIKISFKFVLKGPIDNNPALIYIMAWRQIGDKVIIWTNADPSHWHIYDALGGDELIQKWHLNIMLKIIQYLTHWGRVTHICVSIGSDNVLSPGRRQAIIWTNAGILLIGPLVTNFNETLITIYIFSLKKMNLKMWIGNWQPSCLSLNVTWLLTGYKLKWFAYPYHLVSWKIPQSHIQSCGWAFYLS